MKAGDVIYIKSEDRYFESGEYEVTKVGNKYFFIDDAWVKFLIDRENGKHPHGYDPERGVRIRDDFSSQLRWYPSKEFYDKEEEAKEARYFITKNLSLMDNDEVIDFAELLKERKKELCGTL